MSDKIFGALDLRFAIKLRAPDVTSSHALTGLVKQKCADNDRGKGRTKRLSIRSEFIERASAARKCGDFPSKTSKMRSHARYAPRCERSFSADVCPRVVQIKASRRDVIKLIAEEYARRR